MAKAKTTVSEGEMLNIEPLRTTNLTILIEGTEPLILRGKARSYEREEVFKQAHPKGTKIPQELDTKLNFNLWEHLITSIHWRDEIEHFDDYSLYTEEMWRDLMKNNAPCIPMKAFKESFKQVFISFGFKESTKRNGTDLDRTLSILDKLTPIKFERVEVDQHIAKANTVGGANVLTDCNIFYGWSAELHLSHVDAVFPSETVLSIINHAGEYLGLGSRRAEGFGRYHIVSAIAGKAV
jgi:hypothetical protein